MKTIRFYCLILVLYTVLPGAYAQKTLTLENWLLEGEFRQESVSSINWMNDGRYYSALENNHILKYDVTTGKIVDTIFHASDLPENISVDDYAFSDDESKMLLLTDRQGIYRRSFTAEYFVYDLQTNDLSRLSTDGRQSYATFSPDASKVAFVRDNNLFYVDLSENKEVAITTDGEFNSIIYGSTDWVYEEELYLTKAFFWSPNGDKLAYYRFDESGVKEYNMQVWGSELYPIDYRYKYPKAGEDNSIVEIYVYELGSQESVKMDIGEEKDIYIPRVKWTTDNNTLSIRRLNRLQNQLDVIHANAKTGQSQVIFTEKAKEYVESFEEETLIYLKDGEHIVFLSDRDGYNHIYLYNWNGELVRRVTEGKWAITEFLGVDEEGKKPTAYFMSTEASPLERHLYSIEITGKKKKKLTSKAGYHSIDLSDDYSYYIDYVSSANEPLQVNLYQTRENKLVKTLKSNEALSEKHREYGLSEKEFFTFTTSEGIELNGYFLKPSNYEPNKEYPVLLYQYSGPGSQQVLNSWTAGHLYFHHYLNQAGYIVAVVDPRGTGGRGSAFTKVTYQQLGKYEAIDLIETAKYLGSLDYIDKSRIGIWGWSYGGYMSSLALLKGADYFKMGIAVAPVTSWRFYDTIYTERYLRKPQDNPTGYDDNSPINFAHLLEGEYLLIHGTGDDNVHVQNAIALQQALIDNGKIFDSFFYPDRSHSLWGPDRRLHLYTLMAEYVKENL